MFVFKMKLRPTKRMIVVGAVTVAAAVLIFVICAVSSVGSIPGTATCDEAGEYSLSAASDQDRLKFLSVFGLEADKLVSADIVTIPSEFNSVYEDYNKLQQKIGLDLNRHRGESAERYTYALNGEDADFAVILVRKGKVIGGHITSGEFGEGNKPLTG